MRKFIPKNAKPLSLQEITKIMSKQGLNYTENYKVKEVIYNKNKTCRAIILKHVEGYLTYRIEELKTYDEDEMRYFPKGSLSYYWFEYNLNANPVFDDIKLLKNELQANSVYKEHFNK